MDIPSWATNSPPRLSRTLLHVYEEEFMPGCPASLARDEIFFRKLFQHMNSPFRSSEVLYSPFIGMRYSHARNLYSGFIGIPYSHGQESAHWRCEGWKQPPQTKFYGEMKLVSLLKLHLLARSP